jgi:hypothetical protein
MPSFWAINAGVFRAGFVSRESRQRLAFSLISVIATAQGATFAPSVRGR